MYPGNSTENLSPYESWQDGQNNLRLIFQKDMCGLDSGAVMLFPSLHTEKKLPKYKLCYFIENRSKVPWAPVP